MSLSETLPNHSVHVALPSVTSRASLIDINIGKIYFKKQDDENEDSTPQGEPVIGIDGVDYQLQTLLDHIDNEYSKLPDTLNLEPSTTETLEKAFQQGLRNKPVVIEKLIDDFGVELVKNWGLLRVHQYFKQELASCTPVAAKMLKFKLYFGKKSSRVLKHCSATVSNWAGGSDKETREGLDFWKGHVQTWEMEEALRIIDLQNTDLPVDLQLSHPTSKLLLKARLPKHISKWSQEFIDDLAKKTKLTELDIIKWSNAYKLEHYKKKHGELSAVQVKVLQFMTFCGPFSLVNFDNYQEMICKWAGGTEAEIRASLLMFGRKATEEETDAKWEEVHAMELE